MAECAAAHPATRNRDNTRIAAHPAVPPSNLHAPPTIASPQHRPPACAVADALLPSYDSSWWPRGEGTGCMNDCQHANVTNHDAGRCAAHMRPIVFVLYELRALAATSTSTLDNERARHGGPDNLYAMTARRPPPQTPHTQTHAHTPSHGSSHIAVVCCASLTLCVQRSRSRLGVAHRSRTNCWAPPVSERRLIHA